MASRARNSLLAILAVMLGQSVANAHSSLESTLSFWVRPTGIDVQIYMSRGSAAVLLEKEGEHITIVRENFSTFENRLAGYGPALLSLTGGDGATLKVESSAALLTDEDDICYRLHYPLPGGLPGLLNIHGNYLGKMEDGHVGSVYVLNASNDQLGQGDIRADAADFEVDIPAIAAAAPLNRELPHNSHWSLWAVLGGGLVVIAAVAWQGLARRRRE